MKSAAWEEIPRLGHAEIDAQHRRMIEILDALHNAVHAGSASAPQDELLDELVELAEANFRSEEKLIRSHARDPADFERHIESHKRLLHELIMLRDGLARRRIRASPEIVSLLSNWLFDHLVHVDVELASLTAPEDVERL